jgi:hypothetical protein
MASTTIIDSFTTGLDNRKIKLKVSIEHAQIAKSTVRLNKKAVGEFEDSFEVDLGNAKDLWGITLYVNTTEADISPDSNKTSFAIELIGGEKPYFNKLEKTVATGGFAMYTTEITFIP